MPTELDLMHALRAARILTDIPITTIPRYSVLCVDPRYAAQTVNHLSKLMETCDACDHHEAKAVYSCGTFGGGVRLVSGADGANAGYGVFLHYIQSELDLLSSLKGPYEVWLLGHPDCSWRNAVGMDVRTMFRRLDQAHHRLQTILHTGASAHCGIHVQWEDGRNRTYEVEPEHAFEHLRPGA